MSKNLVFNLLILTLFLIIVIIIYGGTNKNQIINHAITKNNFTIYGTAKIIDGDSIIINKYEIRLFDIDAPEYTQLCFDKNNHQYNCGKESLSYLKTITKNAKLECHIVGKDTYDRYLATCFNGKNNINAKMISAGWAVIYNNPSEYYNLMLQAKLAKKGLWQGKFLEPRIFRKHNR